MRKKMILSIMLAVALLGLNVFTSAAQSPAYDGAVRIKPLRLEQRGEWLYVDIDFVMDELELKSSRGIDFIPQLTAPTYSLALPKVAIKGRNEYLTYERRVALMGAKAKAEYEAPYTVQKAYKQRNNTIQYRYMLPYEPWMADARLDVQRDDCGCGLTALMEVEQLIDRVSRDRVAAPYNVTPHLAYVQPQAEATKHREVQAECFLDFWVNKTDIRPDYMNNPRELAKIHAMIDELRSDQGIRVNALDIIGYASPEGPLDNNKRLSEGRAKALRDYLASRYEFPRHQYHILFGGENWDGLLQALATLDMDCRDEAIEIIETTPADKGRKALLMKLNGGAPYRYLLQNIYPRLRVAICKVRYEVQNFDLAQAKEVIGKHPQNLSLNEMFAVANSYPSGSQEFIEVFETAVRMFPDSAIANLNAAAAAILRNDLVSAERYLNRVPPTMYPAEYNNTAGLLCLLKEDFDQAETYLQAAAITGLEAAVQNLEELTKKKTNTEHIRGKTK